MTKKNCTSKKGRIIQINEEGVREHLGEIVRGTVQETLNALLDEEADRLCNAKRYERSEARKDTRAGYYPRSLHTKAGEVELKVPKLRTLPFETAIIERYMRRETSVEEALVEMYLELVTSDKCLGLVESLGEFYPEALWQRCVVHFHRNVFTIVPKGKVKEVAAMLKTIHAQEDKEEAIRKANIVAEKLEKMKLARASYTIRAGITETLSYYRFLREHWRRIRTNNPLERIMREIRRRTNVVGCFPDGNSALMLVAARLRHIAGSKWGLRQYLKMDRIVEQARELAAA